MLLKLENISKIYEQTEASIKQKVLDSINLQLLKGECITISGPSGSGKSTLLNILGTLDSQYSGNYTFDGNEISSFTSQQKAQFRNKEIGFVFQMHHLLPQLNLLENILLPTFVIKEKSKKNRAEENAYYLLQRFGLEKKLKRSPAQISGGECQRIAIARALVNSPKLLLADEPTGALDQENAVILVELLKEINQELQTSIIMVTHSQELANSFSSQYKLEQGKLKKIK